METFGKSLRAFFLKKKKRKIQKCYFWTMLAVARPCVKVKLFANSCRSFFNFASLPDNIKSLGIQHYETSKVINVSSSLMFQIVSNVALYEEFVPYVTKSFITKRDDSMLLPLECGMRVGWEEFDEEFTCQLECVPNQRITAKSLTLLLFEELDTEWVFKDIRRPYSLDTSCQIQMTLRYCFKNPFYNAVSAIFSHQVAKTMIKAFEKRAMEMKATKSVRNI